jgi:hypothetical protein
MTVSTQPHVLWQGHSSWFDVGHSSSLGDGRTFVGPVPSRVLSPAITAAVASRVGAIVEQACQLTGQAISKNPQMCSRCARTLMRSALGSPEDARLIMAGGKPGDRKRYDIAWKLLGKDVQSVQGALATLRREAASGIVAASTAPARTADPDVTLTVKDSPWAHLYEQGGWPLKAGQWQDYKLCACGDPTVAKTEPTMIVSGVPSAPLASGPSDVLLAAIAAASPGAHHVGGCGCDAPRSPQ